MTSYVDDLDVPVEIIDDIGSTATAEDSFRSDAIRASFFAHVVMSRHRIFDRSYTRDKDGKFSSGTGGGGVRDALSGHESAAEVGAAAAAEAKRITGRDIEFDFAGSDPQIAAEHAEGILQGLERFPKTPLKRVIQGDDPETAGREEYAATTRDGSTIRFTDDAQRYGAAGYRGDLKQAKSYGGSAMGTPTGVALHEFGHAVANSYGLNDRITDHAMSRDRYPQGPGHISRYAQSSNREMIAEGFASAMTRGAKATPIARGILQEMQTAIDEGYRGHVGG